MTVPDCWCGMLKSDVELSALRGAADVLECRFRECFWFEFDDWDAFCNC